MKHLIKLKIPLTIDMLKHRLTINVHLVLPGSSIQEAVANAKKGDIHVLPGVYREQVTLPSSINLIGYSI